MRLSYWEKKNLERGRAVIVVGAGLVGLSSAIEVKKRRPDLSVLVIDKAQFGAAASSRNAGFACFGSVSEICTDIDNYGEGDVVDLVRSRREGIQHIADRFGDNQIEYKKSGGYEIFRNQDEFDQWAPKVEYINSLLGEKIFSTQKTPEPLSMHSHCIFNKFEGQLDTGLLYHALNREVRLNDIEIVRGIEVCYVNEASRRVEVLVNQEKLDLRYDRLIIASNALTRSFLPDLNVVGVRNQVFITEPIKSHGLSGCFHLDKGYVYFRDVKDRILIGGARNLFPEEETSNFGANSKNIKYLFDLLNTHIYPNGKNEEIKIAHSWSGILCGGDDRMPILKRVSDHLTYVVRLSGMGVAIGINLGKEAATLSLQ